MKVQQVWEFVNDAAKEALGKTDLVVNEDLSNIVSVGEEVFNARALDKYVQSLINHIGKVIFVNRPYSGIVPSVLMDGWEFGSILEKVTAEMPQANVNEEWELEDGASYDPNIFYRPKVTAKFYNDRLTFEVDRSITEKQVKMSFSNATQLNGFVEMLFTQVENAITIRLNELVLKTINNMSACTIKQDYGTDALTSKSGVKAINLLYLYNQEIAPTTPLTAANCLKDPEFIKFAAYKMKLYVDRIKVMSTLFNMGGLDRFTPADRLHFVMLNDFKAAADVYLQSITFHNELVKLPNAETVAYWQGSGTSWAFDDVSKISVKTTQGDNVETTGILGVMFDTFALGVTNPERTVRTNYVVKGDFYNYFYRYFAQYFNDFNENFIVFFVA